MIGFGPEILEESLKSVFAIDVKDRLENPLDDVIELEIGRSFGCLISEDDFSPVGELEYQQPAVAGVVTDLKELDGLLGLVKTGIVQASRKRDNARNRG